MIFVSIGQFSYFLKWKPQTRNYFVYQTLQINSYQFTMTSQSRLNWVTIHKTGRCPRASVFTSTALFAELQRASWDDKPRVFTLQIYWERIFKATRNYFKCLLTAFDCELGVLSDFINNPLQSCRQLEFLKDVISVTSPSCYYVLYSFLFIFLVTLILWRL